MRFFLLELRLNKFWTPTGFFIVIWEAIVWDSMPEVENLLRQDGRRSVILCGVKFVQGDGNSRPTVKHMSGYLSRVGGVGSGAIFTQNTL